MKETETVGTLRRAVCPISRVSAYAAPEASEILLPWSLRDGARAVGIECAKASVQDVAALDPLYAIVLGRVEVIYEAARSSTHPTGQTVADWILHEGGTLHEIRQLRRLLAGLDNPGANG